MSSAEHRSARLERLREILRNSLWFLPLVFLVGALVLASFTMEIDEVLTRDPETRARMEANLEESRIVLATIATSILTFLGVVFSVTLVALQMASNQYSPRVVRSFVRSRITKLTLASFMGTFVFSIYSLGSFNLDDAPTVPVVSAVTAMLLVIVDLFIFIAFVHALVRSMRVTYVIETVAGETRRSADDGAVARPDVTEVDVASLGPPDHVVRFDRPPAVLAGVEADRLVDLARHAGAVVRVRAQVGDHLPTDIVLFELWGGDVSLAQLESCLVLDQERTMYQDTAYGIRQLVDIAIRALSPAINDPTTAVQVIDRLVDILARIGRQNRRRNGLRDRDGDLRVIFRIPTWGELVELAFTEIIVFGVDSPQIVRRLLAAFDDLEQLVPPELHGPVAEERDQLRAAAERRLPAGVDRRTVLSPNRRGMG